MRISVFAAILEVRVADDEVLVEEGGDGLGLVGAGGWVQDIQHVPGKSVDIIFFLEI